MSAGLRALIPDQLKRLRELADEPMLPITTDSALLIAAWTALSAPPVDLRPLIEKWRAESAANKTELERVNAETPDADDGGTDALLARWNAYCRCADELDAALSGVLDEPTRGDTTGDTRDSPTAASNEPNRAEIIARLAHKGQTDKAGQPYIEHVNRVWWDVPDDDDEAQAAAWLHDVVEDTELSLVDLQTLGFSEVVIDAVDLLTRKPPFDYASYITAMINQRGRIGRRAALLVKRSDLRDHLVNPGCPETLRPRYKAALPLIEAAIADPAVDPHVGDTRG